MSILEQIQLMKNKADHSNNSGVYEQVRQQIGILPKTISIQATRTEDQPGMYRPVYSLHSSRTNVESGNSHVVNLACIDDLLLQTVKGVVRSVIFFNWKDHA